MRADDVALSGGICLKFPVLRVLLQQHLDDFEGLLPHMLMADVTRWLVRRFGESQGEDAEMKQVLVFLEEQYASGGEHIRELVAVSVLENLPQRGEEGYALRDLLGPAMSDHVRRFLTW